MLSFHMLPAWNELGIGVANHIWQSTMFMLAVGALTFLFRGNRAVVRYRLWLIASVKFLVPFSLLVGIGSFLDWNPVQQLTPIEVPVAIRQWSQPFAMPPAVALSLPAPAALPAEDFSFAPLVAFAWFVGATSVLSMWFIRWQQVARVVRNAKPFDASFPWIQSLDKSLRVRILASHSRLEPGVFGILRPVLLIPEDIAHHLEETQLKPIIAHEISHVRGRDNLFAALHTIAESAFWFHPLVWWLGTRLVDERERACDEAVLQMGCEPADYAEGILKVCKRYVVAPACVAGVSGSNLKQRIEAIMENRATQRLTLGKKLMLITAGTVLLVGPLLSGMKGMPKPSEVPVVSVLASPVPVYETALKVATPASTRQLNVPPPAQSGNGQPFVEIVPIITPVDGKVALEVSAGIAHGPVPVPSLTVALAGGPVAAGQRNLVDDVKVIITDEERKAFQQLTKEDERQNFIRNFWLVRDPTPGTTANEFKDEYDKRVAYANEHFTTESGIPGSQTDRGKMYILNGPPDAVESHPTVGTFRSRDGGVVATFPYETWRYRRVDGKGNDLIYEFVDKQSNGNYALEYDPAAKLK